MAINTTQTLSKRAAVCDMPNHGDDHASALCCQPSSPTFMGETPRQGLLLGFWRDRGTWWRASKNTLNCLIGCSVGDFGMLIFLRAYYPETPVMTAMLLAMATGLLTSILFEATILKVKEGFPWAGAFKVAISMSFISMLGMELVENATDYALTGGTAALNDAWYWIALGISLVAGFLAPLPCNYYKLKKHGQACH